MRLAYPVLMACLCSCPAANVLAQVIDELPSGPGGKSVVGQTADADAMAPVGVRPRIRLTPGAARVLSQPEAEALYKKARALETGEGAPQDLARSGELYLRASQLGHPDAMLALGQMYQSGRGVARDDGAAFAWYRRAAQNGSVVGQYNLALLLADGSVVPRDLDGAMAWYERAARSGFGKAQFNLALLLEQRHGTPADLERAYTWYKLASANGIEVAQGRLAALAPALSPEQLDAADRRAEAWRPGAHAD